MRKHYLLISLALTISITQAQDFNKKSDSLKTLLKSTKDPKDIANINIEIGKIFNRTNVDSAMVYFKRAITVSENKNLINYKAKSYSSLAASYLIKGKFDSAHYYFDKSEPLLSKVDDYKIRSGFYGDKGVLHYYQGNIDKAAENFQKSLEIAKQENDIEEIIRYSNNSGLALSQLGKNEEAITIYYDALKLAENEDDKDQIGKILNNIGLIYENMNQYENALSFYEKSYEVKKVSATQIDLANAFYNMANMQLKMSELNNDQNLLLKAKQNFTSTLNISNENEYGNGKLYGLEGLGQIAMNAKNYDEAKQLYSKMDSISTAIKNEPVLGVANLKLGVIATEQNDLSLAKQRLLKAKEIIEKSKVQKDKAQLYGYLNTLYTKESNFKEAHHFLTLQKGIEDELSSQNLQDKVSSYEVKYQTEKKEKEILSQRADLAEKELSLSKKNSYILGLSALAIVLSLIGFLFYNQQKLKNRQLQKENELKDALLKIETQNRLQEQRLRISRDLHDNIGAQLTFIISSLDNLKYGFQLPEKLSDKLKTISEFTTTTIYELRDTIWAMNKSEITFEDLQSRISNFMDKANSSAEQIQFNFNIDTSLSNYMTFTSVEGMNIYRIIQEAINNALKYADAKTIDVQFKKEENQLFVTISDNGKGFDPTTVEDGNGLNNMKKRAYDIDGSINIHSEITKGTTIQLQMPMKAENTANGV